jgi:hypothetical protein
MNGHTFPVKDDERPLIRHHRTNKVSWPNITLGLSWRFHADNIYITMCTSPGLCSAMFTRVLITLAYPCFCKVYEDVAHLPGLSYDFIIVGGTKPALFITTLPDLMRKVEVQKLPRFIVTSADLRKAAGNVVANRLTENPKFSVLVLEAGLS